MIQCDNCDNWKLLSIDRKGKKHFGCKKIGCRSTGKWKRGKCPSFKFKEGQMLLSEV